MMNKKLVKAGTVVALIAAMGASFIAGCAKKAEVAEKAIYKFSKDNDYYKIKGGIVEGKVMTTEELITLAKLPSRQELLSMLAGGLLANISKFAVALDQVRLQKESGESAPAEA